MARWFLREFDAGFWGGFLLLGYSVLGWGLLESRLLFSSAALMAALLHNGVLVKIYLSAI